MDADHIVIRMADTGPGIPDVEQAMQEGYLHRRRRLPVSWASVPAWGCPT